MSDWLPAERIKGLTFKRGEVPPPAPRSVEVATPSHVSVEVMSQPNSTSNYQSFYNHHTSRHRRASRSNHAPIAPWMIGGAVVLFAAVIMSQVDITQLLSLNRVTLSNYDRIETGMTEAEVVLILGNGEEMASSSIDVPGQSFSYPGAASFSFEGASVSGKIIKWQHKTRVISVQFMNGKVQGKSQFGL